MGNIPAMSDTLLRNSIVALLADYDVEWDDATVLTRDAVQFLLDGKHISVSFDPEADVADVLRRKLRDLGAHKKPGVAEPNDLVPAPEPIPERKTIENRDGYTIFQSAQVIGIELDADLMIERGRVLVIPLRRTNTFLNMAKEDFVALFGSEANAATFLNHTGEHQRQRRTPIQAPPVADEENDILAFLRTRSGGVKPGGIALALGMMEPDVQEHLRKLRERGVVSRDAGFWRLSAAKPPAPIRPPRAPPRKNSPGGVTPQMGRILAAMAYATKTLGRTDLKTTDVKPYLDDRDGKQYSARLPGCAAKGLVLRGRALPKAHGWYYQITPEGIKAVQQWGFWAYENEGQPSPEWLIQVVRP